MQRILNHDGTKQSCCVQPRLSHDPDGRLIFYVLASLALIAEEIEGPFGTDTNDLRAPKMAANIKKYVEELL